MTSQSTQLDQFIDPQVRSAIEQRYYAHINAQAQLQQALNDPLFLVNPAAHVSLFADHGVVHVRDVAQQILQVLDAIHGVLIPFRDAARFAWMKGYGMQVAYAHDIGMIDLSAFGRAMHPEFATQAVLSPAFDDILAWLWEDDRGQVAARLIHMAQEGALNQPPRVVLRELMAMSNGHSKSKTPIGVLNDPHVFRQTMQTAAATDLKILYYQQQVRKTQRALANAQAAMQNESETERLAAVLLEAEAGLAQAQIEPASGGRAEILSSLYADFKRDGYAWLESDQPAALELVQDAVDTLRALRCADALRQRGTVLRTSGSYEVFVDQRSSHAVFALRLGDEQLFLLEVPERISAGEANMASSELDKSGNLRISFHHGAFSDPGAVLNAAYSAALVVNDIQADVVDSYHRAAGALPKAKKDPADIAILIESVDDNPDFADLVCKQLLNLNPEAARHARVVPSLQVSSPLERANYLRSDSIDWDLARRQALLAKIEQFGHKTEGIDPDAGFTDVRLIQLRSGETLIEAGASSGFVYIPLGEGLRILPMGGYQAFVVSPWMPVGVTGVIRGSIRNATVLAEQNLDLLAIPKDVYLKHWHHTFTPAEFAQLFAEKEKV